MISNDDQRPLADVLHEYQQRLSVLFPDRVQSWPLLNGWNLVSASFKDWWVYVLKDAGFTLVTSSSGFGELTASATGAPEITSENREFVRRRLEQYFNIGSRDAILFWPPDGNLEPEFAAMLRRHELALGLGPMKIFLSHKGSDKPLVRRYKETLRLLGFDPWLDEDAMIAGVDLERGLLDGFAKSCAAVFFVTPSFKDEKYLATEVDYAIAEKRKKNDRFGIITLVFSNGTDKGTVPELLHRFVWKEPKSDLEALQEIIRALPICVGSVQWR